MTTRRTLVATTSLKASADTQQRASDTASAWGVTFVPRGDANIETILTNADAAFVFSNDDLHLATRSGRLRYHLGTAFIRLKSLERGDGDPLVRAGELGIGDHVIDTTFGLGRDAVVAAHAIGPAGRVTAIESSDALFHLADEALKSQRRNPEAASIELVHLDALRFLRAQADRSADVVLVDPMFTTPKTSDAGFETLRTVADTTPLNQEWVRHARRVARRWVVLKVGKPLPWFEAEALERVHSHSNASWYRSPASAT